MCACVCIEREIDIEIYLYIIYIYQSFLMVCRSKTTKGFPLLTTLVSFLSDIFDCTISSYWHFFLGGCVIIFVSLLSLFQGVKEFKCEVCGREFTLHANMKRHMLIHASVRPFQCHICFKTFVQKQTLKTHMIVHSPVKPFKCKVHSTLSALTSTPCERKDYSIYNCHRGDSQKAEINFTI